MVVWIDIVLFMCAAAFLVVGIVQPKRSKQARQDALDTFTNRRNAVSCICLGILFVIVVNLYQPITFSKADFIASSKVTLSDWPESPSSWLISWSDFVRYFLLHFHFCLQQHQERSHVKNSALGAFSFTC